MGEPDNEDDADKPNATKKHNEDEQHAGDEKHETDKGPAIGLPNEGEPHNEPARATLSGGNNANTDISPSSRIPKSTEPQDPATSSPVPSINPGASSSDGSFSPGKDHVQSGALRILRGDPNISEGLEEVLQESAEYKEMRTCVNAAMAILSRTRTRRVMATYSIGMVDWMEAKEKESKAGDLDLYGEGVHDAINKWLEKLRNAFPDLYITASIGPNYGSTMRYIWGDDGGDIDTYQPPLAADISIHSGVFDRTCWLKELMTDYTKDYTEREFKLEMLEGDVLEAKKSNNPKATAAAECAFDNHRRSCEETKKFAENYEIHHEPSLFLMAVTLAHECFHVLTGYWAGFEEINTPPKFFGEFPHIDPQKGESGESGEWWEFKHGFNGSMDLVWNMSGKGKDDPHPLDDENMSAGIPFLKQTRYKDDRSIDGAAWTRISHDFIKDILQKGNDRPIHAAGAMPIEHEEFRKKFVSVVETPSARELTTTGSERSAKTGEPRSDRPVDTKLPIVCEDCVLGEKAVPLGCRGPRPTSTASPQA